MARTRNAIISRYHMLKAFSLRQRPIDQTRRLRSDVERVDAASPLAPASAWGVYKRFHNAKCFADNGWLAQYGVHEFTGKEAFHLSLVRQTDTLEHWSDEYCQIELLLLHTPTPELRALGSWHQWSFDYPALSDFFAACEEHSGLAQVLAHRGKDWRWQVDVDET